MHCAWSYKEGAGALSPPAAGNFKLAALLHSALLMHGLGAVLKVRARLFGRLVMAEQLN